MHGNCVGDYRARQLLGRRHRELSMHGAAMFVSLHHFACAEAWAAFGKKTELASFDTLDLLLAEVAVRVATLAAAAIDDK